MSASPDCPKCGSAMRVRNGSRGSFYGCVKYPSCKGTRDATDISGAPHSRGWSGPSTLKAKFDGTCSRCSSPVEAGAPILYSDRKIIGCEACSPGDLAGAGGPPQPTFPSAGTLDLPPVPNWLDGLLDGDAHAWTAPPPAFVLPELPETLAAIPPCAFELDAHQQRVVDWRGGEAAVAASAGSGKSACLIERIVALVQAGHAPESILTLVYNRAAADELQKRLVQRMGKALGERVPAYTFHGFSYSLLLQWFPGRFIGKGIIGTREGPNGLALARTALKAMGNEKGYDAADMITLSGLIRESLIDIDAPGAAERCMSELPLDIDPELAAHGIAFTRSYQVLKGPYSAIDFADMLALVCQVIDRNEARAQELQAQYACVQADEAQDGNPARWRIATWLGGARRVTDEAPKLLSVGDLRQSLYSFVGARPALLKARMDAGATLLTLPVNRRSLAPVVEAGNKIAHGRDWHLGGDATAARKDAGEPVHVWALEDPREEGSAIVEEIKARVIDGLPLADPKTGKANYVLLIRTNAYSANLEIAALRADLPVRVLGGAGGIWGSSPGRDMLAYLRGAEEIAHDLTRIANKPTRYLKRATVETVLELAGNEPHMLFAHLRRAKDRGASRLVSELELLGSLPWDKRCKRVASLLIEDLLDRAASTKKLTAPEDDVGDVFVALCNIAIQLGSLSTIDEQIEAMQRTKATTPAVEICTMHRSKGLQWPVVFVTGATQGVLPHKNARDVEEERRIFYVAVTRAQQTCIVTTSGVPSSFVYDLELSDQTREELDSIARDEEE